MAQTQQPLSLTFTATNDAVTFHERRLVVGMTLQGSGLTAGHRLTVRNKGTVGAGSVLADYLMAAAIDNADLWGARRPQAVKAISLDNTTVAGTWVLTVFFGDGAEDA